MENKTKNKIIVGISIALIILLIAGATYAYLASHQDKSKSADININADTTDTLLFKSGKELSFKATTENFTNGGNDLSGTTSATAILRANSTTNQSETFTYNVYLIIAENTFKYTTSDYQPELLLTVTGPDGVVSASLYTGGSKETLNQADITVSAGIIKLSTNREISTTSVLEEKWEATVTFKNLSSNQAMNGGASFKAKIVLSSEELTLADYVKLAYEAAPNSSIYYHDETLENGAEDLSYRYSGASSSVNNYVCFGTTNINCTSENLYRIIGTFDVDGDYQTKLIKATPVSNTDLLGTNGTYATGTSNSYGFTYTWWYRWADYASNAWSDSLLNKTNLNSKDADGNSITDGFIYNIGTNWSSLIAEHDWLVSGMQLTPNELLPYVAYQNEILNSTDVYTDKVGLMYVSDYAYASSQMYWDGVEYENDNWMNLPNKHIATITKTSNTTKGIYSIDDGSVSKYPTTLSMQQIQPVFYLETNTPIYYGSGTYYDPYRIFGTLTITETLGGDLGFDDISIPSS